MQSALTFSPSHHPTYPLVFNSPFLSHFLIFLPFQHGWSFRGGERCQMIWLSILVVVPQALMWPFIVAACLSHNPIFPRRSNAVFLPSRAKKTVWQYDSGFKRLTRFRSRRISKLRIIKLFLLITAWCKRHSLQNKRYRFFAFCKLVGRRAQSLRRAPSAGHCATGWALKTITLFYSPVNDKRQERSFWSLFVLLPYRLVALNGLVQQVGTAVARPGFKQPVLVVPFTWRNWKQRFRFM